MKPPEISFFPHEIHSYGDYFSLKLLYFNYYISPISDFIDLGLEGLRLP